jgi:hypothetical protein
MTTLEWNVLLISSLWDKVISCHFTGRNWGRAALYIKCILCHRSRTWTTIRCTSPTALYAMCITILYFNILYLSVRNLLNYEFNQNYFKSLTVDWFHYIIIVAVFLFLLPWRWPHEWSKHIGGLVVCLFPWASVYCSLTGLLYRRLWTFQLWSPDAPAPTDAFRTPAAEVGTYGRGRTGKFSLNADFHGTFRDLLHADMGPTALLPFRRKACWGFFRP